MDNGQPSQPILETLRTVEFRLGLKGYNVDEVDEYLEKAALEAERLQEQLRQTTERLRQAGERIAQLESQPPATAPVAAAAPPAPEPDVVHDDTLQRTLLMAQRFVDQTRREAEAEAAELVSAADERARATLAQAENEARQLVTDSQQRLRDEVARLEGMRGQLATDVENMARHLEAERNRLRTMLSEVLKWIDENVQPAESLMALRPRGNGQTSGRARARAGADAEAPAADDAAGGNVAQVLDLHSPNPTGAPSEPRG
jgi:cell division initiation protein